MANVDTIDITKLILVEGTTPSSPAAGKQKLFVRSSDHVLCIVDSSGTVTPLGQASLVNPMTHAWALIRGGTAGAPTELQIGAAGGVLGISNGTIVWNAGTSFPGSPATGDRYYRTDLAMEFYYDGTRWLSKNLFYLSLALKAGAFQISATQSDYHRTGTIRNVGSGDLWLVDAITTFFVFAGGTALGASHNWIGTIYKADTSNAKSTLKTVTINSGSSATWRTDIQSIGALLGTVATYPVIGGTWTKTGTPGDFGGYVEISYRIVAT